MNFSPLRDAIRCLRLGACGFILLALLTRCGSTTMLDSQWRDQPIAVDGDPAEWSGAMTLIEEKNLSLGVSNDAEFLYVSLVSRDRNVQNQILGLGLTLWFDPAGGKEETFGIRFPLGLRDQLRGQGRPERGAGRGQGGGGLQREGNQPSPEERWERLEEMMTELEILGPGEDDLRRLFIASDVGIRVKMSFEQNTMTYELQVPLMTSEAHPYALGAATGTVGVGLKTPEVDLDQFRGAGPRGGQGGPGGGGFGSGGGRPGGGGLRGGGQRGQRGQRPQLPEALDVWALATLASSDTQP